MVKNIENMNENEMQQFINDNLTIKKEEKDKYGEVFTPAPLIEQMLDLFPKKVWSNPNLKWLDPSAGVGNFMIVVYLRLMKGLETVIKTTSARSTHIIKNMLYMVELNQNNCSILKRLFGPKCNLFCADFLAEGWQKGVCDDKCFDCIVGNPPFQDDYDHSEGMRTMGGKNKLYERIFMKSYMLLKDGGYLTFVTPDNIFSGGATDAYKVLVSNRVSYINFNENLKLFFPTIQQTVCYFFLEKSRSTETIIENKHGDKFTLKLLDRHVNPVKNWSLETEKLLGKFVSMEKNNAVYNRGKSLEEYKGRKYKIIYTPSQLLYTDNKDLAVGLGVKKAVIFSISPDLEFKMDYHGTYGVGPNTFYIPFETKKQGKNIEKFLQSEDYKLLAQATKTTRLFLKNAFIQHLDLNKIFKLSMKRKKSKSCKNNSSKNNKTRKNKKNTV
jgi:hypothetical protein